MESAADMSIMIKSLLFKFKGRVHAVSTYSQHWKK
jgi:hypothetical protein